MVDKATLTHSHAGLRLIALMTILNRGDPGRLRTYIAENYADGLPADERAKALRTLLEQVGRLRVRQVLAANEYHVIAMMQARNDGAFHTVELRVAEDYPHKITVFNHQALG